MEVMNNEWIGEEEKKSIAKKCNQRKSEHEKIRVIVLYLTDETNKSIPLVKQFSWQN